MVTVTSVTQTDEFLRFLNTSIDTNDFRYKYLIGILNLVFVKGVVKVTENTTVYQIDNDWIIYIETSGQLFIYGSDNDELLTELSEKMNLSAFHGFEIMGEYNLVYNLINKQNIHDYTVIKDRIFYRLNHTDQLLDILEDTSSDMDDAEELTQMMLDYYHEEYNGTRDKQYDQIFNEICRYIMTQTIHIFKEDKIVKAFCTIIDPDIGIIYTKPEFRKNQIGKKLLSKCSHILMNLNDESYLMTDLNSPASNKMTQDIGYKEIYRHSNIQI